MVLKYAYVTQLSLANQDPWSERIDWIAKAYCDGNRSEMGKKIGVSGTAITGMVEKGSIPNAARLERIVREFPRINPDWLLTGTGPRTRDYRPPATPSEAQRALEEIAAIVDATRGAPTVSSDLEEQAAEDAAVDLLLDSPGLPLVQGTPRGSARGKQTLPGHGASEADAEKS